MQKRILAVLVLALVALSIPTCEAISRYRVKVASGLSQGEGEDAKSMYSVKTELFPPNMYTPRIKTDELLLRVVRGDEKIPSMLKQDNQDRYLIRIRSSDVEAVLNLLKTYNSKIVASTTRVIDAFVPLSDQLLQELELNAAVIAVSLVPSHLPNRNNSVVSKAVRASNIVSSKLSGSNITVGVVSNSVNRCDAKNGQSGLEESISTGNLPPMDRNTIIKDSSSVCGDVDDEGRAVAETVYDVASGVNFVYYMPDSDVDMAQGIQLLADSGCQIIVDDLRYVQEAIYQPGHISQAVSSVVESGVVYTTVAGNYADDAYESDFGASGVKTLTFDYGSMGSNVTQVCHVFASVGSAIKIPSNEKNMLFGLYWNEPFGSLGSQGATTDLDIVVADYSSDPPTVFTTSGITDNIATGDPIEISMFDSTSNLKLSVCLSPSENADSIDSNLRFKLIFFSMSPPSGLKRTGTIGGQSNNDDAITVGAVDIADSCRGKWRSKKQCKKGAQAEDYSGVGGGEIYFDAEGTELSKPVTPKKPDVIAPDCGATSFFGSNDIFCGTSASAPVVAGLAALILEQCPTLSPEDVKSAIIKSAEDMSSSGFDFETGYGLIDGRRAISRAKKLC